MVDINGANKNGRKSPTIVPSKFSTSKFIKKT